MAVGLRLGEEFHELGTHDFVHAFFSTVSCHLEPDGWGAQYPALMNELYQGRLGADRAAEALRELADAKRKLRNIPPSEVVWDIENLDARPPWGDHVSGDISNLSNYFVTSDGKDLFGVMETVIQKLAREGGVATIEPF